jgi:hypothetical protein
VAAEKKGGGFPGAAQADKGARAVRGVPDHFGLQPRFGHYPGNILRGGEFVAGRIHGFDLQQIFAEPDDISLPVCAERSGGIHRFLQLFKLQIISDLAEGKVCSPSVKVSISAGSAHKENFVFPSGPLAGQQEDRSEAPTALEMILNCFG